MGNLGRNWTMAREGDALWENNEPPQKTAHIHPMLGWCWASIVDGWPASTQHRVSCALCPVSTGESVYAVKMTLTCQNRNIGPMLFYCLCLANVAYSGPALIHYGFNQGGYMDITSLVQLPIFCSCPAKHDTTYMWVDVWEVGPMLAQCWLHRY